MVFLYNALPYLIVIVFGLVIRYAVPSKVGKAIFGVIGIVTLLVYLQIQPSYIPKGEVRKSEVVFDYQEKEMRESKLRTPVDSKVWEAKMEEARNNVETRLGEVNRRIQEIKE